jgi:crotonobetainyl-CoA:carnitine CoA-transferase CaiB-like acyl-CoA transferase
VLCAPVSGYPAWSGTPGGGDRLHHRAGHPRAGTFKTVATPVKLEKTPGTIRTPAPRLGEHSRDVLAEAGFTTAEIDSLAVRGVI